MRFLLLAAAAMPLMPAQAVAQSWYAVGGNKAAAAYVDLDSIRPLGNKTIAVLLIVYPAVKERGIKSIAIREEYDCVANVFRRLEYTYYGVDNKVISTEPSLTINEQQTPAVKSIDEVARDFICFRKGGRQVADPFKDAPAVFAAG